MNSSKNWSFKKMALQKTSADVVRTYLWIPEHSMQRVIPRLMLAQDGSVAPQSQQRLLPRTWRIADWIRLKPRNSNYNKSQKISIKCFGWKDNTLKYVNGIQFPYEGNLQLKKRSINYDKMSDFVIILKKITSNK